MKKWTAEELNMLCIHYGRMLRKDMQQLYFPDRSMKSIEMKANKMGLTGPENGTKWTDRERRLLAKNLHMSPEELRRRFFPNKTYTAIASAKSRLLNPRAHNGKGKTPKQPWTDAEIQLLKTYYGTMPTKDLQQKYFPKRTIQGISQKAHMLTNMNQFKYLWSQEELNILKENYGKMPTAEIQKTLLPHRSRSAIENQLTKLRVQRKTKPRNPVS